MTQDKFQHLIDSIKQYEKVAIAYSGGIDSTLLLYAAKKALGSANIFALTLISPVIPEHVIDNCRAILKTPFFKGIGHNEIPADPLQWDDFVENSNERCYLCKKKMYSLLIEAIKDEPDPQYTLLDGTNLDDTKEDRPGRKALQELDIKTPLLDVGLRKAEIRKLAKEIGLPNHDLPSNSCLATRIPTGTPIDEQLLNRIDSAESFLLKLGFSGCRVRPRGACTIIEVQEKHMEKIVQPLSRTQIKACFSDLSFGIVALSFDSR